MTLKTRLITGAAFDPEGNPIAKARIRAELVPSYDVDGDLIVPVRYQTTADDSGAYAVNLWPNERGVNGTQYRITVFWSPLGFSDFLISVPDGDAATPVAITDIINNAPYPPVDAAQQAVATAQAAATQAKDARDAAAQSAQGAQDTLHDVQTAGEQATEDIQTAGQAAVEDVGAAVAAAGLPAAPLTPGSMLRVKGDGTGYEQQTPAQVAANLPVSSMPVAAENYISGANVQTAFDSADAYISALKRATNQLLYGNDTWPFADYNWLGLKKGELLPGETFSRSTAATYWDEYGTLQTAGVNEPRNDHYPDTGAPRGRLRERQSTNLYTRSDSYLTMTGSDGTATFALVADSTVPIDGVTQAMEVTSALGKTQFYGYSSIPGLTVGTNYVVQFLFKPGPNVKRVTNQSGSAPWQFFYDFTTGVLTLGGTNSTNGQVVKLRDGWYWFSVAMSSGALSTTTIGLIGAIPIDNSVPASFRWSGYQIEAGQTPTSLIRTAGSQVTRAADIITIGLQSGPSIWPGTDGSMVFDCEIAAGEVASTSYSKWQLIAGTTTQRHWDYSNNNLRSFDGSGNNGLNTSSAGTLAAGRQKSAYSFSSTTRKISLNGAAPISNTTNTDVSGVNRFYLGTSGYNMWLRGTRFCPHSASDTQMTARSTLS